MLLCKPHSRTLLVVLVLPAMLLLGLGKWDNKCSLPLAVLVLSTTSREYGSTSAQYSREFKRVKAVFRYKLWIQTSVLFHHINMSYTHNFSVTSSLISTKIQTFPSTKHSLQQQAKQPPELHEQQQKQHQIYTMSKTL